jgi:hypothetical protein
MSFKGRHTGVSYTGGQMIQVRLVELNFILQQSQWEIVRSTSTPPPKKNNKRSTGKRKK